MTLHIKDLVNEINLKFNSFTERINKSVSGERGSKQAAKDARKASLELDKLLLKYRKQSVKDIG